MPVNGFNVGRDYAINVQTPSGPIQFNLVTRFTKRQDLIDKKIKGLDGRTRHVVFPDGWSGSFEIERQDSAVDDFFAAAEAGYYGGQNQLSSTITETITEVNGSVSQFQFTNVILKFPNPGDAQGDETVKMTVEWLAERRLKLA
jgi:hypothetical protein